MWIRLFDNEVSEGVGEAGGAPAPAPEPTPAPEATAPETPAEPEAPESDSDDEGWSLEDLAWEVSRLMQQNQQPQQQPQQQLQFPQFQQPQLPELDPYDPESVVRYIEARDALRDAQFQAALDQRFQPIASTLEATQEQQIMERGEQRAQDMIQDNISRNGEFSAGQESVTLTRQLAETLMPAAVERYGEHPRAAEAAIEQAANIVRQIEKAAGEAAVAKHTNRTATLAGAPSEPPQSGVAAATPGQQSRLLSNDDIVNRWASAVASEAKGRP
jgi:hypothetical protein